MFIAQYPGRCPQCEQSLQGSECDYADDDGDSVVVHSTCLDDFNSAETPAAAPGRQEKMCSNCFTVHAGDCW